MIEGERMNVDISVSKIEKMPCITRIHVIHIQHQVTYHSPYIATTEKQIVSYYNTEKLT
jgi:hypothetical protein